MTYVLTDVSRASDGALLFALATEDDASCCELTVRVDVDEDPVHGGCHRDVVLLDVEGDPDGAAWLPRHHDVVVEYADALSAAWSMA